MQGLKEILESILKSSPQYKKFSSQDELFQQWDKAVGAQLAKHTKPLKILDGSILLVWTSSSAWSHQLRFMEPDILKRMHENFPNSRIIKSLKFTLRESL